MTLYVMKIFMRKSTHLYINVTLLESINTTVQRGVDLYGLENSFDNVCYVFHIILLC